MLSETFNREVKGKEIGKEEKVVEGRKDAGNLGGRKVVKRWKEEDWNIMSYNNVNCNKENKLMASNAVMFP